MCPICLTQAVRLCRIIFGSCLSASMVLGGCWFVWSKRRDCCSLPTKTVFHEQLVRNQTTPPRRLTKLFHGKVSFGVWKWHVFCWVFIYIQYSIMKCQDIIWGWFGYPECFGWFPLMYCAFGTSCWSQACFSSPWLGPLSQLTPMWRFVMAWNHGFPTTIGPSLYRG